MTARGGSSRRHADDELYEGAAAGDPDATTALVHRYWQVGVAAAARVLGDRHLAADATQEAFVAALASRKPEGHPFRPWFLTIVRRKALDHRRRSSSTTEDRYARRDAGPRHAPDPGIIVVEREDAARRSSAADWVVRAAESSLGVDSLEIFLLSTLGGQDASQVATHVGKQVGAVYQALTRARARVRRRAVEAVGTVLSADERAVCELRYCEGASARQAADRLGLTVDEVEALGGAGLRRLRAAIEEGGPGARVPASMAV